MPDPEAGDRNNIEAMEMLTHGQGLAFQLRDLLLDDQGPVTGERLALAEDLLDKIHGSLTNSISALDRHHSADELNNPDEDQSGESSRSRRSSSFPKPASRRKRETSEGESWIEITSTLVHDGHAWRKYGQKPILNANHSRSYFKCTHKDQFGCPAKKHVQQIADDPLTFRTVYTFRHTCTIIPNRSLDSPAAQMVLDSTSAAQSDMNLPSASSFMLNFQSNPYDSEDHNNRTSNALMKQEYTFQSEQQTEDHLASVQQLTSSNNNLGSSSDVEREVPYYMNNFSNCSNDYSPYISYPQDTDHDQDPGWF